jgi:hypothetical protein
MVMRKLLRDGGGEGRPRCGAADLPDEERYFFLDEAGALEHDVMRAACGDDAPTARGEVGEIALHAAPCIHHGLGLVVGQVSRQVDRRIACESVVRTLVAGGAIGILSTHDLTLTSIAELPELRGMNCCMESDDPCDPLNFDLTGTSPAFILSSASLMEA